MWNPAKPLRISDDDRTLLEAMAREGKTPQRVALRAQLILGAAAGRANNALAKDLGVSRPTVLLWRDRFRKHGIAGILKDAPRPGRRKKIAPGKVEAILAETLQSTPRDATHWSTRPAT
jgi:transposase